MPADNITVYVEFKLSTAVTYTVSKAQSTPYFYIETEPQQEGNYWHFDDDGNVLVWQNQFTSVLNYLFGTLFAVNLWGKELFCIDFAYSLMLFQFILTLRN